MSGNTNKEFKTLKGIVEQLEFCNYECEGGILVKNTAFLALKEMAEKEASETENCPCEAEAPNELVTSLIDPNFPMKAYDGINAGFGTHTIEIYLQSGDFKGTIVVTMGGNCAGYSVMKSCIDSFTEFGELSSDDINHPLNQKHLDFNEDYIERVKLFNADEEELSFDYGDEREMEALVVSAKIVDFKED